MDDSVLIESFLKFLIEHQIVDNGQENETLSKFLELYEQFEDQLNASQQSFNVNTSEQDSQMQFETKAIFTLADFLKGLSANEYYDIAQKMYN